MINISKTDYILYRDCAKNAWYKIHRPDLYYENELSEFEKHIIETGNEVELVARELFPTGVLVEGRDKKAQEFTSKLIKEKEATIFQPVFVKDGFLAAVDILKYDKDTKKYSIYEVKASNEIDKKLHYYDLAFQSNLLKKCGLNVDKKYLLHLNSEYVRSGELDIVKLFTIEDISEEIDEISESVDEEMEKAKKYLTDEKEPVGYCGCIYKGRSGHCTTFHISNPEVPDYSVHDIARIGNSKAKLANLIDCKIFNLHDIPEYLKEDLSDIQVNQIEAHTFDRILARKDKIKEEFDNLVFPLYFLDYETFPSALPRYDGYSPYQQIPFQYSLHVVENEDSEPKHFEFIYTEGDDPSPHLAKSLQNNIGKVGTIIVWNKGFECGRNREIAKRFPEYFDFMEDINSRVYDLMDIFKKQYFVHKDFRGSTSIKKVLPVLAPELSYKTLEIQEGGTASESWNKIVSGKLTDEEKDKTVNALLRYCELDTYAMYAVWRRLVQILGE